MSETDSFIEEVTEEVRRDKLFALFRRYGWIGILAVLLIVGGAGWNEWRKAQDRAAAEALGDRMISALESDRLALSRAIMASSAGASFAGASSVGLCSDTDVGPSLRAGFPMPARCRPGPLHLDFKPPAAYISGDASMRSA